MPQAPGSGKNRTKRVAFGGVFAALAASLMLLGGFLPLATFSAPIFASICILFLLLELGPKTALLAYGAVSLLSLFLVADKEIALLFVLVFGFYPVLQASLARIKAKPFRVLLKLLFFNLTTLVSYFLLLFLFADPVLLDEFSQNAPWFWAGILLLGNIVFFAYDMLLDKLKVVYFARLRPRLFRK